MELPKRVRTADWENGVLTLDGEKKFEIPELTSEIIERLAGYGLVGFHVKGYPGQSQILCNRCFRVKNRIKFYRAATALSAAVLSIT